MFSSSDRFVSINTARVDGSFLHLLIEPVFEASSCVFGEDVFLLKRTYLRRWNEAWSKGAADLLVFRFLRQSPVAAGVDL